MISPTRTRLARPHWTQSDSFPLRASMQHRSRPGAGTAALLAFLAIVLWASKGFTHNLGHAYFAHSISIGIEDGRIDVDYTIEIPSSVIIGEFLYLLRAEDGTTLEEKSRRITETKLSHLRSGLLLLLDGEEVELIEEESLEEKTGLGNYYFFQYRLKLRAEIADHRPEGVVTLINRNYPVRRSVYYTAISAGSGVELTGSNLLKGEGRFMTDPVSGRPWATSQSHRAIRVEWGRKGIFSVFKRPLPSVIDNKTIFKGQSSEGALVGKEGERGRGRIEEESLLGRILTAQRLELRFVLSALAVAIFLGASHALSPGHGKTIVAAYLVGSSGRVGDAVLLGLTVTVTHVASVMALGAAALVASQYIVPEQIIPYLGCFSGLLILAIGAGMLIVRLGGAKGHTHPIQGGSSHHTHRHDHTHDHGGQGEIDRSLSRDGTGSRSLRGLISLGISGGIVPCPTALVILLTAVAFRRILFGMALVVSFSMGLAVVLIAIGIAMVKVRGLASRADRSGRFTSRLPVISACVIMILGFSIAVKSLLDAGIVVINF